MSRELIGRIYGFLTKQDFFVIVFDRRRKRRQPQIMQGRGAREVGRDVGGKRRDVKTYVMCPNTQGRVLSGFHLSCDDMFGNNLFTYSATR